VPKTVRTVNTTTSFKRYERKYMVTKQKADEFYDCIKDYITPDRFCVDGKTYRIFNLYLDTDDYEIARNSVQKPNYKEKARFRAYENYAQTGIGFLEVKRKIYGVGVKRRIKCSESDAVRFMQEGIPPVGTDEQMTREFAYYFKVNKLSPKMYIAYDRRAYYCTYDPEIRVTFDFNITYRDTDVTLSDGDYGKPILSADTLILELKFNDAMPLWLAKALAKCKIYPHSFSKYGTAYRLIKDKSLSEVNI